MEGMLDEEGRVIEEGWKVVKTYLLTSERLS